MDKTPLQTATFAAGCFWCVEAIFAELKGVVSVTSGYTGGTVENPTYAEVCSGETGHAESVQIEYDPDIISYKDLLEVFWRVHDPTTLNYQGADTGTEYRSAIFFDNDEQKQQAEQSKQQIEQVKLYSDPVVTEIVPLGKFYPAEPYQQEYYQHNGNQPYCRLVIDPKIQKFRKEFGNKLKG